MREKREGWRGRGRKERGREKEKNEGWRERE